MNLIVAVDNEWGIGQEGKLLFSIPEDMQFFKKMTINKVVIMGHNTLKSLPNSKPLKNRVNIVLSRDENLEVEGAVVCHSVGQLFEVIKDYKEEELFVIGGEKIYSELLKYCKVAYITKIYSNGNADRHLENLDEISGWKIEEKSGKKRCEDIEFEFTKYINNKAIKWN